MDKKKVKSLIESNSKKVESFNTKINEVASGWVYPSIAFLLIYVLSDGSLMGKAIGAVVFFYLILPKVKDRIINKLEESEVKPVDLSEAEKKESVEVEKE